MLRRRTRTRDTTSFGETVISDPEQAAVARSAANREALLAQCPSPPPTPADAADLPIHVSRWGETGPRVVLVHGGVQGDLGGGPDTFSGQRPLGQRGWRLEAIDRPGFGASPSRGVDDMEVDGEIVGDRLGERAHLIGHSFGGAVALLAAARRPEAVTSLILIEPALQGLVATDAASMADPQVRAAVIHAGRPMVEAASPSDLARSFAATLGAAVDGGPNPASAALAGDDARAASQGCSLLQARMASGDELAAAARVVVDHRIPVLVISGGYSGDEDSLCRAAARLLGGRHEIVASPNHFVQQASPVAFNELVDAFMRESEHDRPR